MPESFEKAKKLQTTEHADPEKVEVILTPEQKADLELIQNVFKTGKPIGFETFEPYEKHDEIRSALRKLDFVMRSIIRGTGGSLATHRGFIKLKEQAEKLGATDAMIQKLIKISLVRSATGYGLNYLVDPAILNDGHILDTLPEISPKVFQEAMKESMALLVVQGNTERAIAIKEQFDIPEEFANEAAKEKIINLLSDGHDSKIKEAIKLKNEFGLSPEITSHAAEAGLKQLLYDGVWSEAEKWMRAVIEIKHSFGISDDFLLQEINDGIQQDLKEKLKEFNLQVFFEDTESELNEIQNVFSINIDEFFSQSIHDKDLIRYVSYLGDEEICALKFPLSFQKIRERIVNQLSKDQDLADYFLENLGSYYQQTWAAEGVREAVIHFYSVAIKFAEAQQTNAAWQNEPWAIELMDEATEKWFQLGDNVQEETWGGNGSFSESDPFENHKWRWGKQQVRLGSVLAQAIEGGVLGTELEELGINVTEIAPVLEQLNETINFRGQEFLEEIRLNTSIPDDDKNALLNPDSIRVKIISLFDTMRSLVARYIVQIYKGDTATLNSKLASDELDGGYTEKEILVACLDNVIKEGLKRYTQVLEIDVPLYDKLYEEFDTLRETGRSPLEVYLGRDGVYAYIGRRAQDVARQRKLGLRGRKEMREKGEILEIHPKYLVYPRYFRDNLNYETKRELLEQEGISPEADPLFYDTGYTGTIPEQIMKIMDFGEEDIERRIRLLSAPSAARRVKGIPENARQKIIEYIEHNSKSEETAVGLIKDEKTGKIRHIAEPTNPTEQFYFMMIKQAIARHYWLQEQLHHEPSGNVNLDSEHYTIRIRQEYAKLLPAEFMQNPKAFFAQQGELLKGSKGQGEYPDEEIILFKLADQTEIVAKRIELRKAKEARKEFSILISAKKAGLPTAEPVGFLSGKGDADGSYLLMKKIEGISGRNFDKYLRESGKYTEEQIQGIMRQVAEKNKEMAELFRTTLKIDKRWRVKDTIIELNEKTGEVESVTPIDWERVQDYDPNNPKEIDKVN